MKDAKALAPPVNTESGILSDAITSDISGPSPASSAPTSCNTPVAPSTLEKVCKYFTEKNLNKKNIFTLYYQPFRSFVYHNTHTHCLSCILPKVY